MSKFDVMCFVVVGLWLVAFALRHGVRAVVRYFDLADKGDE